jgi:hypothetical protein
MKIPHASDDRASRMTEVVNAVLVNAVGRVCTIEERPALGVLPPRRIDAIIYA